MGSRRRRFGAVFVALAALGLLIAGFINAGSANANAGNPLAGTTGSATTLPNGDVKVTVSGTWQWGGGQGTYKCNSRFGTGWAVAWGDPNEPGNLVSKGAVSLLVGTPTDNTVHYDLLHPDGTCVNDVGTGPWSDSHTYKAGTPIGDICVNMYDLHDSPAAKPGDFVAGGAGHNGDNSVETNAFDPNNNLLGFCFKPAKIKLHKVNDHVPPQALPGAVFGLYAGSDTSVPPVTTCTSVADGTCDFSVVNPGDYTIKEISAPAGYSVDPNPRAVHANPGDNVDVQPPFVDPRDTGWARIVKHLEDGNGNAIPVADKHVFDGAAFVLYTDKNNSGSLDAGETAKLWPAETADASCTISGGTGQCDIGPVVPGGYRVHETAVPANMTAGPDVDVTVVKSTQANPAIVNFVNNTTPPEISLVKSGPSLAHVGDTFTYTFDATTNGQRLHNIQLAELAPNRCTTPISAATGDANNNGFLEKGETWHWTCSHTVTAADPNPLPNTAKVTGTDDFGRIVSATDDHSVIIIHPAILVEKSGAAIAHEGDTVTYTFKVTNTGDTALFNVTPTDDKLGSLGSTIALLSSHDSVTITKDFVVPAGTAVDNIATACGKDSLDKQVCDDDHHHLVIIHPAIEVTKSAKDTAHIGDSVTYTFVVKNVGDTALSNVAVNDDKLGSIGNIASLAVGESKTLTKAFTVPDVATVDNTATACGTDSLAKQVCDDDHHHLVVIHPGIEVVKSGPATSHVGDTVTYSFKVTNTGDVNLTNVKVTDDKLGAIGTIGALAVGESKTLTKDFVVPNVASVTNTATACGDDPLAKQVCDDDHHKLDPIHPAINIVKSGPALAHIGDTITYKFEVTNPGDVPLHTVVLTDPKCDKAPVITAKTGTGDDVLDLEDHWFYDCTHKVLATDADPLPNTGTVTGIDPLDKTVTDSDDHTVDIIHPAILIEKSAATEAHEGDKVTYSFKVTNKGDVDLTDVKVTDDKLGDIGTIPSLAIGESKTLTKDFTVPTPSTSDIENTATACGTDPLSTKVCDDDHHKLIPKHPKIDVLKRGPATASVGQTITYTFVVTNVGDIDLINVQATDDKLGAIGTIPSLAVGQSVTLSKDFVVPAGTAVDNIVTACGTDTLSVQVCDTDNHHLDIVQVLGEQVERPTLAVTGKNLGSGLLAGMLMLLGGISLRRMRRRARQSDV